MNPIPPTPEDDDAAKLRRLGLDYGVQPVTKPGSNWTTTAGIGLDFVASVVVCTTIGWWLDRQLQTSPWLVMGGTGLGFGVGLWLMVKAANRSFRHTDRSSKGRK